MTPCLSEEAFYDRLAEGFEDIFLTTGYDDVPFKQLARSPFYRADGLAAAVENPARRVELEDAGLARLLTPEQLERKIEAVFGRDWGRLHEQFE